jgi:hypothetical protein
MIPKNYFMISIAIIILIAIHHFCKSKNISDVAKNAVKISRKLLFDRNPSFTVEKFDLITSQFIPNNAIDDIILHSTSPQSVMERRISKGEQICREVLESYFKKPFPTCRPKFLRNNVTGKCLELDCYNDELKIAVEYNGAQHYKFIPKFHQTEKEFMFQKYRDQTKHFLCKQNGIKLITIPYTVSPTDIRQILVEKLNEIGY